MEHSQGTSSVLIGYASGLGAGIHECAQGPEVVLQAPEFQELKSFFQETVLIKPDNGVEKLAAIPKITEISSQVAQLSANNDFFVTLGGDHTSALGSYSGAANKGTIGLIWVDAHLDSHTAESSHSKNTHGMPLAALLGHGDQRFTQLYSPEQKLLPENVCIVGARSYEAEEQSLLESLGVRIFYMDEVNERGLASVFEDACQIVQTDTTGFCISIDIDAIDPLEAPGTGAREPNGIHSQDLIQALSTLPNAEQLLGVDITEFNPTLDQDRKTELLVIKLLATILAVKGY